MAKIKQQHIVIVGCGNVAWHIAAQIQKHNKFHLHIYNHRPNPKLFEFSSKLKCQVYDTLHQIKNDADYYILCIKDSAIKEVCDRIQCRNPQALVMHTSGSIGLTELGKHVYDTGVMYPLQTFSKNDQIIWPQIPVIIEASGKLALKKLESFANLFSKHVYVLTSEQRANLHLSAVFVNNFTNALFVAANQIINQQGLKFNLLLPLIHQTIRKLESMSPMEAQTGPAKRKEKVVMNKHLHLLKEHKDLKKTYKQLSKLIVQQQNQNDAEF